MPLTLPKLIAHRGASAEAPENTLAAFRKAAELGAEWVEFDVMLTADAMAVVHHDDTLKRITGVDRPMAETSFAKLTAINAKIAEPIPTLIEVMALLAAETLNANIEIKPTPGRAEETAEATLQLISEHWRGGEPPLVSSFDWRALQVARAQQPELPLGLLVDLEETPEADWRGAARALQVFSLHLDRGSATPERIAEAKAEGLRVLVYTVNDPAEAASLLSLGADAVFTDDVRSLKRALG